MEEAKSNELIRPENNELTRAIVFKSLDFNRIERKEKPGHPQSGAGSVMFRETNPEVNQKLIETRARASESFSRSLNQARME